MKNKIRYFFIATIIAGSLSAGLMKNFGLGKPKFTKLPDEIQKAVDNILIYQTKKSNSFVKINDLKILSKFIINNQNSGKAWLPKPLDKTAGAAIIDSFNIPFDKVLKINLATNIPDAALFFNMLRYSKKFNLSPQTIEFFKIGSNRLPTNKIIHSSYYSIESITPNIQSGAYYTYTNIRTITRANINGTEIMLSLANMIPPSDFSMRGAPVGPVEDGVFYYSKRLGLNLPGVSWAKSQMYCSKTLAVYLETPDKKTAVTMISWQSAGWKGVNIIKSHHIYSVLQDSLKAFDKIFGNPSISLNSVTKIINKVKNMTPVQKKELYVKYKNYVEKWRAEKPKGFNPFRKSLIDKIFNDNSFDNMSQNNINMLIIQEYVRNLIGKPTWSITPPIKKLK